MIDEVSRESGWGWSEELDFELDDSDASDCGGYLSEEMSEVGWKGAGTHMVCRVLRACIVLVCTLRCI